MAIAALRALGETLGAQLGDLVAGDLIARELATSYMDRTRAEVDHDLAQAGLLALAPAAEGVASDG